MASAPGYPITMVHPDHTPADIRESGSYLSADKSQTIVSRPGRPERFPNVEVHDDNQEAQYRAQGYLRLGEARPKRELNPREFPKMMVHPDHEDAAAGHTTSVLGPDGGIQYITVPPRPGKFPDRVVNSPEEEEQYVALGYRLPGEFNESAYEIQHGGTIGTPYPRWEKDDNGDDVLVQDPNLVADEVDQYPKMIHFDEKTSKQVNNEAEEAKARADWEARGSSKSEPVKRSEPAKRPVIDEDEWAEFQEFKRFRDARLAAIKEETEQPQPADARDKEAERQSLLQLADEAGIKVDRRWGVDRLTEAIEAHQG